MYFESVTSTYAIPEQRPLSDVPPPYGRGMPPKRRVSSSIALFPNLFERGLRPRKSPLRAIDFGGENTAWTRQHRLLPIRLRRRLLVTVAAVAVTAVLAILWRPGEPGRPAEERESAIATGVITRADPAIGPGPMQAAMPASRATETVLVPRHVGAAEKRQSTAVAATAGRDEARGSPRHGATKKHLAPKHSTTAASQDAIATPTEPWREIPPTPSDGSAGQPPLYMVQFHKQRPLSEVFATGE
ncbi:hypothetical protein J2785_002169 [Burkholderia ambifaria]|nr:hypothetical protein [Burkholderia ambifaria]MDR6499024.1 hypothetical protein [Burkholderia ambifaria]